MKSCFPPQEASVLTNRGFFLKFIQQNKILGENNFVFGLGGQLTKLNFIFYNGSMYF